MIQGRIHRLRHDPRPTGWGKEIGEPLNYTFQFGTVMDHFPDLLDRGRLTIRLSALAMVVRADDRHGLRVAPSLRPRPLRWLASVYVEFIRNTPFLIQLYFVFFALPNVGVRLNPNKAALSPWSINLGAYSTEIVRAGVGIDPASDRSRRDALWD